MTRLTEPATLLLFLFIGAVAALALTWRAERRKATRRLGTLVEAARVRSEPGADDDTARVLQTRLRPRSALAKRLSDFLIAAGYRGTSAQFVRNRAVVAIATGYALALVGPLGWVSFAVAGLLVAGTSYLAGARAIQKRMRSLDVEFPGAIDIMVRGIRTGMPLIESMRVVAAEGHPIIAKEFQKLIDELALGVPFGDAVQRMVPRIPISDIEFFAVVLGLQAESGGSVADTLQSAADTMRNRRELRKKVSIMSREARSSAAIIGSLPIIVSAVMAFTSPDYIGLLLTTSMGNIVALAALIWAGAGILVMRAMINFEI